jgi:ABC-type nitrate/sulfonate/bicarbonate transport system substrate-binding protein
MLRVTQVSFRWDRKRFSFPSAWLTIGLVLAAAWHLVLPAPATAQPLEQTKIEIVSTRDPQLGAHIAISVELGLFKEQGLDVTVHWTQSGADIITFLANGSQYLASGGEFPQLVLKSQNVPVKTIARLSELSGAQGLVLAPGVKLNSPKELEGKKLAYVGGTPLPLILTKLATMFGFDAGKVSLVTMQPSESVVASARRDVDGMLGFEPFMHQLVTLGGTLYVTGKKLYVTGKEQVLPLESPLAYYDAVLIARQEWIDQKPNTVRAVLRALLKADGIIKSDRPRAMAAIQKILRVDTPTLTTTMDENVYGLDIDARLAKGFEFVNEWAVSIKRIPPGLRPEDVLETKLLREVAPELVTWPQKQ